MRAGLVMKTRGISCVSLILWQISLKILALPFLNNPALSAIASLSHTYWCGANLLLSPALLRNLPQRHWDQWVRLRIGELNSHFSHTSSVCSLAQWLFMQQRRSKLRIKRIYWVYSLRLRASSRCCCVNHHGGSKLTEIFERPESNYTIKRRRPCFNSLVLKLINNPLPPPTCFKYDKSWASWTGRSSETALISTMTWPSTTKSKR